MDDCLWNLVAKGIFSEPVSSSFDAQRLAKQLGVEVTEITTTLDALAYMEEYRTSRGLEDDGQHFGEFEFAFRQIVSCRRRIPSAGDKVLFAELAFVLLDDTTPRPISRDIEWLGEIYSRIRDVLTELMPGVPQFDRDDLSLLGRAPVDPRPFFLSRVLRESHFARIIAGDLLRVICV